MTSVPRGVVVTGLYRSGTTLVERLLGSHPDLSMASQPAPFLHTRLKADFLEARGLHAEMPFGHRLGRDAYDDDDLRAWLRGVTVSRRMMAEVEAAMEGYDGWWSPELSGRLQLTAPGSYAEVLERICRENARLRGQATDGPVGCKEILIEDMAPYLLDEGFVVVLVLRDLRDVLVSLFAGAGQQIMGPWRPMLHHVRQWRRSVAACLRDRAAERFLAVRYDDVVRHPGSTLAPCVEALGLESGGLPARVDDVKGPSGGSWSANSSFSAPAERPELPGATRDYIEALAGPEMVALGLLDRWRVPTVDELRRLREPAPVRRDDFPPDYSTREERLRYEIDRLRRLAAGDVQGADFLGVGAPLREAAGPPSR